MKKFTMVLMGAFVIAVASAFTTEKSVTLETAWGYENGVWIQVNPAQNPPDYECNAGTEYCLYQTQSLSDPVPGQTQNKQFHSIRP